LRGGKILQRKAHRFEHRDVAVECSTAMKSARQIGEGRRDARRLDRTARNRLNDIAALHERGRTVVHHDQIGAAHHCIVGLAHVAAECADEIDVRALAQPFPA